MVEKESTVGQHALGLREEDAGGDLPIERPQASDIEKVERVYR